MAQVVFKFGTRQDYELAVSEHQIQDNILYFLLDTNELYRGFIQIGQPHFFEGTYQTGETFEDAVLRIIDDVVVIPGDILLLNNTDSEEVYIYTSDLVWRQINTGSGSGSAHATNVDDVSIELKDNLLSLKDYGVKYYRYIPADQEHDIAAHYEVQEVNNTHPWKAGLEPRVVFDQAEQELVLGWYEPNTETVSGLANALDSLQDRVTIVEGQVATNINDILELQEDVAALGSAFMFQGSLETMEALNAVENPRNGDVYQVGDKEYVWNGSAWVELGINLDFTPLQNRLNTLETIVGVTDTPYVNNSLIERVDALEQNHVNGIVIDNTPLTPNAQGIVSIPIFEGSTPGLVPGVPDNGVDANYVLGITGAWIEPADSRIGNLTYANTAYPTVEDYVTAVFNDVHLEWENI